MYIYLFLNQYLRYINKITCWSGIKWFQILYKSIFILLYCLHSWFITLIMFILIFFNTVEPLLSIWIKEFLDETQTSQIIPYFEEK